jgi:hypothetical protein
MAKNLPLSIETVPISPIYIAESSGCAGPPRGAKKRFVVLLVEKDFLPRTATVHYVFDGSGILNTKRPRHENGDYHLRP